MELKVWVDGVLRVVCGLSLHTSCQDVVIALAQFIGQTGRYILLLQARGTERQLLADDCPLQLVSQLGPQAAEVHFLLRRTGPSLSEDRNASREALPLHRPAEPEPPKGRDAHKAAPFISGPSTTARKMKPRRAWSPSPRASPELRASPVSFLDPLNHVSTPPPSSAKEDVFRQILQQEMSLEDLEIQLQALEKEVEVLELKDAAGLNVVTARELEELEQQLRQNQIEMMDRELWEGRLQEEINREQDMHGRLHEIQLSADDQSFQIRELISRAAHLEDDLRLAARRRSSHADPPQTDEALEPLKQELLERLQQGDELETTLRETQRTLRAAEQQLQDRWRLVEELNKELRQCNLQQFIQQATAPHTDPANLLPGNQLYLQNAGIME